jgi:hypothetical protein
MVDLAVEILHSVPRIVRIAQKVAWGSPFMVERATKRAKQDSQYAISMLELFADETFCRCMVDSAAITAVNLLRNILKSSSDRAWGSELIDQLIRQAITSRTSALRRERGFSGLGRFKSFQTDIFRPPGNAVRLFDRLSWSSWHDGEPDVDAHETYCDCLLEAFEGYIDAGFDSADLRGLSNGFKGLLNFYVFPLWKATENVVDDEGLHSTAAFKCADRSQRLLEDCLSYLLEHSLDTLQTFSWPDTPTVADDNKLPPARTIYDCLGDAMFAHFASLSSCKTGWRSLRETALRLWHETSDLGIRSPGATAGLNVQDRLLLQLRTRLNENVRNQGYAPITRTLVSIIGIPRHPAVRDFFEGELRDALAQIVSYELGRYETVDNMLPDYVTWDAVGRTFVDAYRPKRQRVIPFGDEAPADQWVQIGDNPR